MSTVWDWLKGLIVAIVGGEDTSNLEIIVRMTGLYFGTWAAMIYGVRYGKLVYWTACRWIKKRWGGGK